jgi:hypothetical protein
MLDFSPWQLLAIFMAFIAAAAYLVRLRRDL